MREIRHRLANACIRLEFKAAETPENWLRILLEIILSLYNRYSRNNRVLRGAAQSTNVFLIRGTRETRGLCGIAAIGLKFRGPLDSFIEHLPPGGILSRRSPLTDDPMPGLCGIRDARCRSLDDAPETFRERLENRGKRGARGRGRIGTKLSQVSGQQIR